MKKIVIISLLIVVTMSSCSLFNKNSGANGELIGVQNRPDFYEDDPHGMVLIPAGSFTMGQNDEDVAFALTSHSKTVSVDAFWMDNTEIINNEYRQFVYWVRDSIARRKLVIDDVEAFKYQFDEKNPQPDNYDDTEAGCYLNWEMEIPWNLPTGSDMADAGAIKESLEKMYLTEDERFNKRREIDTRLLIYEYQWVDLKQAAKYSNRYNFNEDYKIGTDGKNGKYKGTVINSKGKLDTIKSRKSFIMHAKIPVYPDTLVWMADYTYSYNEPLAKSYFWHPAFDSYPVVGINWKQANAFSIWRTQIMRDYMNKKGEAVFQDYRLPTEAEWEYAARGGLSLAVYPWGGPYTRNNTGCFIANFKPTRGVYGDDGANETLQVGAYNNPNEWGLYDMAGNVAEWTSNAFDESAYSFTHDLNPDYTYNAREDEAPVLKRKVIRGGSWKDIGYYLQVGTRTYEYQDTAKSYIGFRCVRSFLGQPANEWDFSKFN